ncbi:MAG: hypothetical protein KJ804_12165 [Proteobacteria bacterium]|nr:hypothetical protein [Pseudomonadota bacterium]MBU1059058.1 hypothetical protein [Pseudomonadota bacterium]
MNKNVEMTVALYQRLGSHAQGFEDPASVIERILDFYEEKLGIEKTVPVETALSLPSTLGITYYPSDEESFKQLLLQKKVAYLLLHKIDGTKELKEWNAINFTAQSSVNGNLRSGYLRDWQKKGIIKAEISTDRNDLS